MAGARNNPAEPTGTAHSGVDVHVHVHVCGRDEQISTYYGIKDEVLTRAASATDATTIINLGKV